MLLAHSGVLAPLRCHRQAGRAALPIGRGTSMVQARRRVVAAAQGMPGKEQHDNAVAKAAAAMLQRELQRLHRDSERFTTDLAAVCTPKQAGDFADWALMIASTVVFTFIAMQLYRVYLFLAYPHLLH